MSIYAQAIQSGVQFASLAAGVESAETIATYNREYQTASSKLAASNARSAAEANISAVNQDRITSNVKIKQKQDEAEANAKVSAALAGAKGASVEAVVQQTEVNEAHALSASNKAAEQQIENLSASVYNSSMQMQVNVETPKTTIAGNLLKAASSFEMSDLQVAEAFFNESPSQPKADAGTLTVG